MQKNLTSLLYVEEVNCEGNETDGFFVLLALGAPRVAISKSKIAEQRKLNFKLCEIIISQIMVIIISTYLRRHTFYL